MKLCSALLESFDALQAFVLMRDLKETTDATMERLRGSALEHMPGTPGQKGQKALDVFGAQVSTMKLPGKWDFTMDPSWIDLHQKFEAAKEALKKHEDFMKKLTEPVASTVTGNIVNPAKCLYDGGETLKISFPKDKKE